MPHVLRAVAIDYDGTLTDRPRPKNEVLAALRTVRDAGYRCILVTGRRLAHLRSDFGTVDEYFDAIVAENGCVLSTALLPERALVEPIPIELDQALASRGILFERGQVLLASRAVHAVAINEEIARLGIECHIVRNRSELMVLPGGVSKGTGVVRALEELNLSPHGAVAIGDAENDHSLLDVCEIGVAVANGIAALKARADVVLDREDGDAVSSFLEGPLREGLPGVEPQRWRLVLGTFEDGTIATLPASGINIAIDGPSGGGKSWFAGNLAEQLIGMRYTTCIVDMEGDHADLGELHGAVTLGGERELPSPVDIGTLMTQGLSSIIVDLSLKDRDTKLRYSQALLDALKRARTEYGIPHWIMVDEAHALFPAGVPGWWCAEGWQTGLCVITYRPDLLCPHVESRSDVRITVNSPTDIEVLRRGWPGPRRFRPAERSIEHLRHWHKYLDASLPVYRHFHFRDARRRTGRTAGNLIEFDEEVRRASIDVLRHHAEGGDFSRWLGDLWREPHMTQAVQGIEATLRDARSKDDVEDARLRLHHLLTGPAHPP
jgi:hydroxymethylpyrimidine pyrophosphatase-like HAD family hydrolase